MPRYSEEPDDRQLFTDRFDRFYTRFARSYDLLVKVLPVWKNWLRKAVPNLIGPRILEVSFGTGWLMTQYVGRFEVYGVDLNDRMVTIARQNLRKMGLSANLQQGSVESLPFPDAMFDTVLCTMAFSGYPRAQRALSEMVRVLKPNGRVILVDINYPGDASWLGMTLTRLWIGVGDLVRDMRMLFDANRLSYTDEEIGAWGSVHLYVASLSALMDDDSTK